MFVTAVFVILGVLAAALQKIVPAVVAAVQLKVNESVVCSANLK